MHLLLVKSFVNDWDYFLLIILYNIYYIKQTSFGYLYDLTGTVNFDLFRLLYLFDIFLVVLAEL